MKCPYFYEGKNSITVLLVLNIIFAHHQTHISMRKILTPVLLFIFSAQAFGQYTYGEPVESSSRGGGELRKTRFGLFIAPNNSWMKPTASKSNDGLYRISSNGSKIGYSWGLMVDYFFAENYGIATGVQLNTTGGMVSAVYDPAKLSNPAPVNYVQSADIDYRLQYFEVPFGLKLMSDDLSGGVRIFGNIGITAAINFGKKGSYNVSYTDTMGGAVVTREVSGENEKIRTGLSVTPILFQMNLGAGIEYQVTEKMSFYTGLFFNNGFAPDVTSPKDLDMGYKGTFTDGNIRLNNLSLKIGMFF